MNNIDILKIAISEGKQVSFDYQSSKDMEASPRQVHAWMVAERKDTTYLIGHQGSGGTGYAIRQYKVDGMKNLKTVNTLLTEFPDNPGDPKKWDKILVETKLIVEQKK